MKNKLLSILILTLFVQADKNLFLETLNTSYVEKIEKDKKFSKLLSLYLAEEKPFMSQFEGKTYSNIEGFIYKLVAHNQLISNSQIVNAHHQHTLKGLKSLMSEDYNLIKYIMNIRLYTIYLRSMQCENLNTKNILLQNYPLDPKKIYLQVIQKDENELLEISKKTLNIDLSLEEEQRSLFHEQVMIKLKENSDLRMKNLTNLIKNGSGKEIQDFYKEKSEEETYDLKNTVKALYSQAIISVNRLLGINQSYFAYAPEVLAITLDKVAKSNTLEVYKEHKAIVEKFNILLDQCTETSYKLNVSPSSNKDDK
ncbi:MAG: Unknown protein [uncultured Sulfurovum sp.]|uniref:Uncharacterized protein n=1 Tax=uncultured Sulfurovum sp. TaxID=269237 RepID=A0A6S6UDR2_9BACT|nr:MAG: Unknown protein [uncultured Sulfurovum sp.]